MIWWNALHNCFKTFAKNMKLTLCTQFFTPYSRGLIQLFFLWNLGLNNDLVECSTQLHQNICKKVWNWPYVHNEEKSSLFPLVFWAVYYGSHGDVSIKRHRLTSIGNPIAATMGFPILVRRYPYIESGFRFRTPEATVGTDAADWAWRPFGKCLQTIWPMKVRTLRHWLWNKHKPNVTNSVLRIDPPSKLIITEREMLSFGQNFHYWLHWELSFWKIPVAADDANIVKTTIVLSKLLKGEICVDCNCGCWCLGAKALSPRHPQYRPSTW